MFQMDLEKKFQQITGNSAQTAKPVSLSTLQYGAYYSILGASRINVQYGPTVLLDLDSGDNYTTEVKVFLPKRYAATVTDQDIEDINAKRVKLSLAYMGICPVSKSFLLSIKTLNSTQ